MLTRQDKMDLVQKLKEVRDTTKDLGIVDQEGFIHGIQGNF